MCQAFVLRYCLSCFAKKVSLLRSRLAACVMYSRLMIEGSRCNRLPSCFTVTLPHSRATYTNVDLALTHFRC